MNPTLFDIETEPLPLEILIPRMPEFNAPSNYKDADKIKASIEAQKQSWLEDAALSPMTGRVLVFGYLNNGQFDVVADEDESILLKMAWEIIDSCISTGNELVGFNCNSFDLPFMVRRSWASNVKIPKAVGSGHGRYWNWSEQIINLRTIWQLGNRQDEGSLDSISKFFGQAGKSGSGKDFAALWKSDRPKAILYLQNDLNLTASLYAKMMA